MMARIRFRWGMGTLLLVSMVALVSALITTLTYSDIRRERSISHDRFKERVHLLAGGLNDVLANHIYLADVDALRDISEVFLSQPDITYVDVFTPDGRFLVRGSRSDDQSGYATGFVEGEFGLNVARDDQTALRFDGGGLEFASPILIGDDVIGVVQFGFTDASVSAEIRELVLQHLWQGLVLTAVGIVYVYMIARYTTKPLHNLAAAAAKIGQGELDAPVPVRGTSEISVLGQALEDMRSQLQGVYAGMERKVEERTRELIESNEKLEAEALERSEAEERIKRSLQEKEVLLKEINHRVKNNLQIIISLLNLQSRDIQDEQTLRSFEVSQNRIRAMALVHEKLYQSDDLARIDFGQYINRLATDLRSSYGIGSQDVNLIIDVDSILLGVDSAIPCGVIVNELVANSLKHAFPENRPGEIIIHFSLVGGQYILTYKDDGIGLPDKIDINHPSSLGLTIINALTGQLGGTIDRVGNTGSEINITFPVK